MNVQSAVGEGGKRLLGEVKEVGGWPVGQTCSSGFQQGRHVVNRY